MSKKGFGSRESFQKCEDPSDLFYLIRHPTSPVAAKAAPSPDMTPKGDPLIKEFEEKLKRGELQGVGFGKFIALAIGFPPYFIFYRFPKWLFGTLLPLAFKHLFYPFVLLKGKWQQLLRAGKEKCIGFAAKFKRTKKIEGLKKTPWSLDLWVKTKLLTLWKPIKNALMQPFLIPMRMFASGYMSLVNTVRGIKGRISSFIHLLLQGYRKRAAMLKGMVSCIIEPVAYLVQSKTKSIASFVRAIKNKATNFYSSFHGWMTKPREKFRDLQNAFLNKMIRFWEKPNQWKRFLSTWYQEKKRYFIIALKNGPDYAAKILSNLLTFVEKKLAILQTNVSSFVKKKWAIRPPKIETKQKKKSKGRWHLMIGRLRRMYLRFCVRLVRPTRPLKRFVGKKLMQCAGLLRSVMRPAWLSRSIQTISQPVNKICGNAVYCARWCRAWVVVLSWYGWSVIQSTSAHIHLPLEKT